MLVSRFPIKYIFTVFALLSISYVLSLFLLQLFGALLFIMWLLERWDNKLRAIDTLLKIIFIFGLIRFISILFSSYPSASNEALYKEAMFYTCALAFFFYVKTFDKKKLLELLSAYILGAMVMSLVGIVKFTFGIVERAEGFSSSYSVFSSYLLTALALSLFYPLDKKNKIKYVVGLSAAIIIFIGIVASLGRTNIAIAVLLLISAIFLRKMDFRSSLTVVASITIIFVLYYFINPESAGNGVTTRIENISQLSDRDIIWKGAKELMFNKPIIGYGPRTFNEIFPLRNEFMDKKIGGWHNDALQIYFESGLIGLITFLLLLIYPFYSSVKLAQSKILDVEFKNIAQAVLASIIAIYLSAVTAGFITSVVLSIVFVFLLSIVSRLEFELSSSENKLEKIPNANPAVK